MLPVVHSLRQHWPQTRITWVIGKHEHRLMQALPDVEFVVLDKAAGWRGYRQLFAQFSGRRFDVLLLMQVSMRAHIASLGIRAQRRIGYDAVRGRDCHGLFVRERIPFIDRQHVLEAQLGFLRYLGLPKPVMSWSIPIADADRRWAAEQLPGTQPTVLLAPASSVSLRNWSVRGYAGLLDYAQEELGLRAVICGGPSRGERQLADEILAARSSQLPVLDLVGQDTLPQLLAMMERRTVVVGPDSGPAHMAALAGTPVIGLYGLSNPQRCGPYRWRHLCVDAYPRALHAVTGKTVAEVPWGTRVESIDAMAQITLDEVCTRLREVCQAALSGAA
jgi:heptosyltransferase I